MDKFIKPGNLEELLETVPYSGAPERSYNHPVIQGVLVFEAQNSDNLLEQARAFYLLHIVFNNRRMQTQITSQKDKFEKARNKVLTKSRELFTAISAEADFEEQKETWRKKYVFTKKDERVKVLTALQWEQDWMEYEKQYNLLEIKYMSESILVAKAAFHKKTIHSPREYLQHANKQYYAEGFLALGEYLQTLAQCDLSKETLYLEKAKQLYKRALLEYNDIRGYNYFVVAQGEPDEEMEERHRMLKAMHDELERELTRLTN
jgi:hypothetical protein